ncbi:MAG: DNA methyltransferase [Erysipelotrichaceae bacterium]
MYSKLENKFNVIYPDNSNATYMSLLNYSDDLSKPFQRWFRYKEGFSVDLVKHLIEEYNSNKDGTILDPFLGGGSTIIAANMMNLKGVGFEVNPFSHFLASCKLKNYSLEVVKEFLNKSGEILAAENILCNFDYPKLSFSEKVFNDDVSNYFMSFREKILTDKYNNPEVRELMLLGWLSCLEEVSNYRKAGNGLKKRKYVKPRKMGITEAKKILEKQYLQMLEDIKTETVNFSANVINDSSLNLCKYIGDESISGIVFSPPYANCFDYTEIYKLELWFGEFVKEYKDLKELRKQSLRSHLNGDLNKDIEIKTTQSLTALINKVKTKELWDKKIPKMLECYFSDMFNVIDNCFKVLEKKGFCCIVVGNSSYGDVIFPTDLILAEYAQSIGFKVDKIEIDRFIITSSQQYESTKENKKYLRESVICLAKE